MSYGKTAAGRRIRSTAGARSRCASRRSVARHASGTGSSACAVSTTTRSSTRCVWMKLCRWETTGQTRALSPNDLAVTGLRTTSTVRWRTVRSGGWPTRFMTTAMPHETLQALTHWCHGISGTSATRVQRCRMSWCTWCIRARDMRCIGGVGRMTLLFCSTGWTTGQWAAMERLSMLGGPAWSPRSGPESAMVEPCMSFNFSHVLR